MYELGGSNRKNLVLTVSVPGQKGLMVCSQDQSVVLGHDSRRRYRCGMDTGVDTWTCRGMISLQHFDKRVG